MTELPVGEDFVQKFHGINDITIGERRRTLFKLLRSYKGVEIDSTKLKPKNPLEETFKIDVLIYLKDAANIIDVFKTEKPALIKKVLKIDWLWNSLDEKIVREIFPLISFNSKLKITNKLAVHLANTQQADAIFAVLKERYGMYLAAKMLPCCSSSLISQHFTRNVGTHLKIKHILCIIKRHPSITRLILENAPNSIFCHRDTFIELFQNHLELIEKFYNGRYFKRVGWRATEKFVHINKANVINNPSFFYYYLHKKQLIKSIGTDFPQFYINTFPEDYDDFRCKINYYVNLLDNQDPKHKYELLASTCETKYGVILLETDIMSLDLFEIMNNEQRLLVATRLDIPNVVTICVQTTKESLPALQKLLRLMPNINKRKYLVRNLVETCRINNDMDALLEVCKYVYKYHRNDDLSILTEFLSKIETCFPLNKLREVHWLYIGKVLKILILQDPSFHHLTTCLYAYAYFLYMHGKTLEPVVQLCAQKEIDIINIYKHKFKSIPEFEKQYLVVFGEVLPKLFKNEDISSQYIDYLCCLVRWNKNQHNFILPLLDNRAAMKAVLDKWENGKYNHQCELIVSYILCTKLDSDKSFWVDTHFKKTTYNNVATVEWLIKYEPLMVLDHVELIINSILEYNTEAYHSFFRMTRHYSHLELPEKITKICINVFTSIKEADSRKRNALIGLSYVVIDPQEFIKLLTPYYPIDKTESDVTVYSIQQVMSKLLGNIVPPSSMIESVLLFSKGDYTKFNLHSMYLLACNVTENKLSKFFNDLNNLAVSVRKHAIYLGFAVLDRNSMYKIVKRNLPDKNVSIRKFLMRSIFKFFIHNHDDFVWNILKDSIINVGIKDQEAMNVLAQLDKVPYDYMVQYIELSSTRIFFDEKLANLLINWVYTNLGKEVILKVINLGTYEMPFICECIINSNSSEVQLSVLENAFIRERDLNKAPEFLKQCAKYFIIKKYSDVSVLHKCCELLQELQPHDKYVDDYLYLQLCEFYVEFYINQNSMSEFAKALVLVSQSFINKYKLTMFHTFFKVVDTCIKTFMADDLLLLVQNIIDRSSSAYSYIMAICLLPERVPSATKLQSTFNQIIKTLRISQHPIVRMSLSLYLNDVISQHDVIEERVECEPKSGNSVFNYSYEYTFLRYE